MASQTSTAGRSFRRSAAVVCVCSQLVLLMGTVALAAPRAPSGAIPPLCISSGQSLQSSCKPELDAASKFFNIGNQDQLKATKITDGQISTYLSTVKPPSASCCHAACDFNFHYCNCDPTILSLASSFTGNNPSQYIMITNYFASKCGFELKTATSNNCPAGDLTKAPSLPVCAAR